MRSGLTTALVSMLCLVACGGSTTTPTPVYPAVAGTWGGTIQTGNAGTVTAQFTLAQSNSLVSGIWSSPAGWKGTVSGTVATSGSFSGVVTISTPNADGTTCSGSGSFGGAFTTGRFSAASNGFTGDCANLPNDVNVLTQRQ